VEEQVVGRPVARVGDDALGGVRNQSRAHLCGGRGTTVLGHQLASDAGNVGGGHRGSGDGRGGIGVTDPRREDIRARGKDVSASAPVGEGRASVSSCHRVDRDGVGRRRRREVATRAVGVARRAN